MCLVSQCVWLVTDFASTWVLVYSEGASKIRYLYGLKPVQAIVLLRAWLRFSRAAEAARDDSKAPSAEEVRLLRAPPPAAHAVRVALQMPTGPLPKRMRLDSSGAAAPGPGVGSASSRSVGVGAAGPSVLTATSFIESIFQQPPFDLDAATEQLGGVGNFCALGEPSYQESRIMAHRVVAALRPMSQGARDMFG